jgi:hypothetical protein
MKLRRDVVERLDLLLLGGAVRGRVGQQIDQPECPAQPELANGHVDGPHLSTVEAARPWLATVQSCAPEPLAGLRGNATRRIPTHSSSAGPVPVSRRGDMV